jgi:protein-disulfide isomerase
MATSDARRRLTLPAGERDRARGPAGAALTLLEYGDFECPQCARAFPVLARIQRTFADRLRFVFRHFPLTNSHPQAQHAAEATEWAASLGAFWEMHDALYTASPALSDGQIVERATALGLPAAGLRAAWAAHTFIPRVKEDFKSGLDSGVTGTPAFFINGVRHDGQWDEDSLTLALERAGRG